MILNLRSITGANGEGVSARWKGVLPRLTLALALAWLYAVTLAPSITWLHDGADGGDLIAAAMSNGVAHPSGYPLYLLLVKPFLWLPFNNPAWRANVFSAVCAIGSALVVCEIVSGKKLRVAGLLAGFAWGVSGLLWSQAVIAEVYALHIFLVALNLCVLRSKSFWGRGLALGFALSNHLTAIFLLPIHLVSFGWTHQLDRSRFKFRDLGFWFSGFVIGLLPYALLPLWASGSSSVNWGGADSVDGFRWLITGEAYGELVGGASVAWFTRLQTASALLIDQFGLIGLGIILIGFSWGRESNWEWLWLGGSALAFALTYNTADSYLYLLPAFLACAVWWGRGLKVVLRSAKNLRTITVSLTLLALFWNMIATLRQVDASRAWQADEFMMKVLQTAPLNAKIVTHSDRETFALWYAREALGERRDLQIVVEPLLRFAWYQRTLEKTFPHLEQAPFVCQVGLAQNDVLSCVLK